MEFTLASTIMSEAQIRAGQEVIAAVFPRSEMQFGAKPSTASDLPSTGGQRSLPEIPGERMNSMFKNSEVSELVLTALFKEKLKAALDVQKVDIVDHTSGRDLVLTGCIPGDEDSQPLSIRVSTANDEEVNLHDLIEKLGLPEQPAVPEYSEHGLINMVGELAGFDTSDYYTVEASDSASIRLVGSGSSNDPIDSDLFNDACLTFKGFMIQGIDLEDLWTFLCTLEHHGEFHALCTLYRIYELAA